jgi:hypothetical protein
MTFILYLHATGVVERNLLDVQMYSILLDCYSNLAKKTFFVFCVQI